MGYRVPDYGLQGQVAVVTGAGQGLGLWIAIGLATAGADLLIADLNIKTAHETCEAVKEIGRKALPFEIDVSNTEHISAMMEYANTKLGSLDIIVNNAGVNVHKKALDITPEDFDFIVNVNCKGIYFCCQEAAKIMIPKKKGKIINIASAAAFLVRAGVPNSVYSMTKAGIVMLTKALAEEWSQYNINVNAIAPGYFNTPLVADRLSSQEDYKKITAFTPLKRIGEAEDIMGAAVFLASEATNYITGQTISVDGGRTIL